MFRSILIGALALTSTVAFAASAPAKKKTVTTTTTSADGTVTKKTVTSDDAATATPSNTLMGSGSVAPSLHGLSLFAAYDFADELDNTSGGHADTDRAFDIGASYEFSQFSPGISAQIGGQYDFSRSIKNADPSVSFSEILPFAELTAHLTPMFKLMGGINYNFPSASNLNGATIKGNVGYQFGGSFEFNPHVAIDARYRSVQYSLSANNQSVDLKENGFVAGARYMF